MKHFFHILMSGIVCAAGLSCSVSAVETEEMIVGVTAASQSVVIQDFPLIYQEPELPTGCEITAMTMVLNYYGLNADKVNMALEYLPVLYDEGFYYGEDGRLFGNDMENYFIGDPATSTGYICGPGAIVTAANRYLSETGSLLRAVNMTGISAGELYELIDQDIPIVIWGTIGMEERGEVNGWYREDGVFMDWSNNDHGTVLIGYTGSTVVLADPVLGYYEIAKDDFEDVYKSRGCKCVILR
ncbi:MAG: C39 family peptidase [Eubacteriales bacterium]|nr:C39 family peptidase [Eubacteriales bacterium]